MSAALGFAVFFLVVSSWFAHLYVCFTEELWGFLIAGAVFFPVGVIHGFGAIVGFW